MNRRTIAAAVPALLLLAGCGGNDSGGGKAADAKPASSTSAPAPRHTTPSAAPTTDPPGQAEVEAQVAQALLAAHAPADGQFTKRSCVVGYFTWDIGMHLPHFRKDVVAALRAAGWKVGPGGGPAETELVSALGWEVFVEQRDLGKVNGTGSPTRELRVSAQCT